MLKKQAAKRSEGVCRKKVGLADVEAAMLKKVLTEGGGMFKIHDQKIRFKMFKTIIGTIFSNYSCLKMT